MLLATPKKNTFSLTVFAINVNQMILMWRKAVFDISFASICSTLFCILVQSPFSPQQNQLVLVDCKSTTIKCCMELHLLDGRVMVCISGAKGLRKAVPFCLSCLKDVFFCFLFFFLAAYFNDIAVGAVCCRVDHSQNQKRLYIMTLGCLAPYRRLGIGKLLNARK